MPPFVHKPVAPPLKWHGGKFYLADWIISLMPPRGSYLHYVEPYFGGGSVLLRNNPEGISEVANDLDRWLINFWNVIRDDKQFPEFAQQLHLHPFCEDSWRIADNYVRTRDEYEIGEPSAWTFEVHKAIAFFIRCRQSLAGRMSGFTSVTKRRTRGGMNAEVSAWLSCVEGLPEVHARMKRVLILNRPALEVIDSQDGPETLFYLDPPYLHETRVTTGEYGENEMSEEDHRQLLMACAEIKGRFLLSGYRSNLYDDFAKTYGWNRHEKVISNNASSAKVKPRKTECVWTNY